MARLLVGGGGPGYTLGSRRGDGRASSKNRGLAVGHVIFGLLAVAFISAYLFVSVLLAMSSSAIVSMKKEHSMMDDMKLARFMKLKKAPRVPGGGVGGETDQGTKLVEERFDQSNTDVLGGIVDEDSEGATGHDEVQLEGGGANASKDDKAQPAVDDSKTAKTPWNGEAPPTPAWWLESDPDDSFERIYLTDDERKQYKNLRDLGAGGSVNQGEGVKGQFNPMCRHYRFNTTLMPTVSVIVTTSDEPDAWISTTVESILARTPSHLLKEVIVVDDNGMPGRHGLPENIRKYVDEEELKYIQRLSPKVQLVQHEKREGCGRSRLSGARVATGEVLMFVDSHIEMMSGTWYQHLVYPIMENPRTIGKTVTMCL